MKTNLGVARIAEEPANSNAADTAETAGKIGQCTVLYALPAERKQLFLLNRLATGRFIAEIVSRLGEAITDKVRLSVLRDQFQLVPFCCAINLSGA